VVEAPGDDAVELPLSVLAPLDGRSSHVDRGVSVQPLLAEHREEGGEERSGETRVEDGLNLDDRARGTGPLWDCGDVTTEGSVVDLVDEDTKESGCLCAWVLLELGVDLDNECGCHGGEQTSLQTKSARPQVGNINEPTKMSVVFKSSS